MHYIYREREERERGERETECWGSQVHNTDTMSRRSQLCPDTITERDSIPPSSSGTSSKRNQQ